MEIPNQPNPLSTKKCPKCKEDIQKDASKCPRCNSDLRNWFMKHKILTVIFALIIISIIGNVNKSGTPNTYKAPTTSTIVSNNNTEKTSSPALIATQTEEKALSTEELVEKKAEDVPAEYKSALSQATSYANTMNMSKQGVYDQLVSEYGGKFSAAAAQYGIDNVKADWNANALVQAKNYQDTMHLSPAAIRDQLVSKYGGKFTAAEADYAIQHLND